MDMRLTVQHILEYINLWVKLNDFHKNEEVDDYISWNLTPNGKYLKTLAQFLEAISVAVNKLVWKAWHPL
jgi:hypothetical protein